MSYGVRRTLLGALGGAAVLALLGAYWILARHLLPFGVLSFVLAAPLLVGALNIALRLRAGDQGSRMAAASWNGDCAGLLISRPLSTADDLLRKYVVKIDGKRVAALGYGDAIEVQVDAGPHKVVGVLDGTDKQSEPLDVACVAGRRTKVYMEPFAPSTALRKSADQWITLSQDA